jgi:hypothetical protein
VTIDVSTFVVMVSSSEPLGHESDLLVDVNGVVVIEDLAPDAIEIHDIEGIIHEEGECLLSIPTSSMVTRSDVDG